MNLTDLQGRYTTASTKASDVARQLALAGIAIVWFFSGGEASQSGGVDIAGGLRAPGLLLVLSLSFDFLHVTYLAALWGVVGRLNERKGEVAGITFPSPALWFSNFLFWGKLILLGASYLFLAIYFSSRL